MVLFLICLLSAVGATSGIYFGLGFYHEWYTFWVWILCVPCFFLLSFFLYIVQLVIVGNMFNEKKERHKTDRFILFMIQQTCWMVCFCLNIRIHSNGMYKKFPKEPFLLVSNHLSNFDQIVFFAKLNASRIPMICITKDGNFHFPIIGPWIKKAGYIAIDRENPILAQKALEEARKRMQKEKVSVFVCPEGTRSKDHHFHEFHHAPFSIASEAGCPLVVMAIRDTYLVAYRMFRHKTRVFFDLLEIMPGEKTKGVPAAELSNHAHDELMKFFISKGVES